ncbi:MAG: tRNA 2-thiouridine synthesizing protein C [Cellvibrionaceae bacterium]|jgi:tRNA 2-thiouridine synthesizing protein C
METQIDSKISVKVKKIGIIIRHAPYGNNFAQETLDAILAASVYGQILTLIFIGDGVFQLLKEQDSKAIQQKSFEKQLTAFELYDLDRLFICKRSLDERGVNVTQLSVTCTSLDENNLRNFLHEQDTLLSF